MKFEDMESAWAAQTLPRPAAVDPAALKRVVLPELHRRRRLLVYGLAVNTLAVVLLPVLAVANFRYDPVRYGTWWSLLHVASEFCVVLLWFAYTWRRWVAHRQLLRQGAKSVRASVTASLAAVETEIRDLAISSWPMFWLAAVSVIAAIANGTLKYGWSRFGLQASLGTAALLVIVASGLWQHYRRHLLPTREKLRGLLAQME